MNRIEGAPSTRRILRRSCQAPAAARAANHTEVIGAEERRDPRGAARLHREQSEQDHHRQRQRHKRRTPRLHDFEALDGRQHRQRRRDQASSRRTSTRRRCRARARAACVGPNARKASAVNASVPPSPLLSARSRISTYLSVTTMISDQKISDSTPIHRRLRDRAVFAAGGEHRVAQRVKRAGADVAIDDADRSRRSAPRMCAATALASQRRWRRECSERADCCI